jgi:hypothetical protein
MLRRHTELAQQLYPGALNVDRTIRRVLSANGTVSIVPDGGRIFDEDAKHAWMVAGGAVSTWCQVLKGGISERDSSRRADGGRSRLSAKGTVIKVKWKVEWG